MRWRSETYEEKKKRLETWRPWFAWRPVMIDNERVWLEWVYCRTKCYFGPDDIHYSKEYADTMSILKKQKYDGEYDGLE